MLSHYSLPEDVAVVDAGTGICDYLFDLLLSPVKPSDIFVVDAVSVPDRTPGELFELSIAGIPIPKATDFSLHQFPSVNLLAEINSVTRVQVLAVQAGRIPDVVEPGLSPEVRNAVAPACAWLLSRIHTAGKTEARPMTGMHSVTMDKNRGFFLENGLKP
jgi:coenzyme F420 hydrogenase subunit delta